MPGVILPVLSCDGCGKCCQHMVSPPFTRPGELAKLPQALRTELKDFYANVRDSLPEEWPCLWLDQETKRCRHYDLRPPICREFEMGGEACLLYRETLQCPA